MYCDYLIAGSGAAAQGALSAIRWQDPSAWITVITDDEEFLYPRPALFQLLKGSLEEERLANKRLRGQPGSRVSIILGKVERVLPWDNQVITGSGERLTYGKLLLATGSIPVRPAWPGSPPAPSREGGRAGQAEGVYTLWSLSDARKIKQAMKGTRLPAPSREGGRAGQAVVVGGGTLGMQLAEAMAANGLKVHHLVREDYLGFPVLEQESSRIAEELFRGHGINLLLEEEPVEIVSRDNQVTGVITSRGRKLECTLVGVAIGNKPEASYLEGSGIEADDGILVNEYLQTNFPHIYAAGTCARVSLPASPPSREGAGWAGDTNSYQSHTAHSAALQGRVAGLNMAGGRESYSPGLEFAHLKVFDTDIVLLGDVHGSQEGAEILTKDEGASRCQKFFIRDGRISGAVLVGDTNRFFWLKRLMEEGVDISGVEGFGLETHSEGSRWLSGLDDALQLGRFYHESALLARVDGEGGGERFAERSPFAMAIDLSKCIGCYACTVACSQENRLKPRVDAPGGSLGSRWNQVYQRGPVGRFPDVAMHFLPTQCSHCQEPLCLSVCHSGATYQSPGGQVLVDGDRCLGCLECLFACPFGARYFDGETGQVEKCNLCMRRVAKGLEPACVATCPAKARVFFQGTDAQSEMARLLKANSGSIFSLPQPAGWPSSPNLYYIWPEKARARFFEAAR